MNAQFRRCTLYHSLYFKMIRKIYCTLSIFYHILKKQCLPYTKHSIFIFHPYSLLKASFSFLVKWKVGEKKWSMKLLLVLSLLSSWSNLPLDEETFHGYQFPSFSLLCLKEPSALQALILEAAVTSTQSLRAHDGHLTAGDPEEAHGRHPVNLYWTPERMKE